MAVERFPVDEGQIMLFARAIGDPNPIYYDRELAAGSELGGVIAPPTFVQSAAQYDPDWIRRPKFGEPWYGSGREPSGVELGASDGVLHAEQHFTYHRTLMAGDVLHALSYPGNSWTKQGRQGLLSFRETITEYRDETDQLVITARAVLVVPSGKEG